SKLTMYTGKLKDQITDILKPLKSKPNANIQINQNSTNFNTYQISKSKSQIEHQEKNNNTNSINLKKSIKHKKTEEGFTIYSEKELKIGRGKDTPECPFDCDCCNSL
ncbi:hypothetical protein PORY_000716, partial [Pneumocystis oryctolagi]